MHTIRTRKFIKDIAKKYNMNISDIENILYSFPDFLNTMMKDSIAEHKYYTLGIKWFGKFYAPIKYKNSNKEQKT